MSHNDECSTNINRKKRNIIQTFLPFANFAQSAKVLDGSRLRKQQTEAEQILKTLQSPEQKGWRNHPAVLQWKGYEDALQYYIATISQECVSRGYIGRTESFGWMGKMPPWMGREDIHSSHRSRLLFKGRVDAASEALKKHLKVRSINSWFKQNGWPQKNQFQYENIVKLDEFLTNLGISPLPNYYAQFGWTDSDKVGYVWPVRLTNTNDVL